MNIIRLTREQERKMYFSFGFFAGQDQGPTDTLTEYKLINDAYDKAAKIMRTEYEVIESSDEKN